MLKRLLILFLVERVGFFIYRELALIKPRKRIRELSEEINNKLVKNTK